MKKGESDSHNVAVIWSLLLSLLVVFAIIYFKLRADDMPIDNKTEVLPVAVPDTTSTIEMMVEEYVTDTLVSVQNLGTDTRSAMEAGDEDGYWDGWYDGAETGKRSRYDENSSFASATDRQIYAENYREGYAKGFAESTQQKDNSPT